MDNTKCTVKVEATFDTVDQANTFVTLMAWMELCGNIGHSSDFVVHLDGDGAARPKFLFDTAAIQKRYEELRHDMCRAYDRDPVGAEVSLRADTFFVFE